MNKLFTALCAVFLLAFPAVGQVASRDFEKNDVDRITVDGVTDSPTVFTIALWFKQESGVDAQVIYGHRAASQTLIQVTANSDTDIVCQMRDSVGTIQSMSWAPSSIVGEWHHLACVVDTVSDAHYFYADGSQQDTDVTNWTGNFSSSRDTIGATTTSNGSSYTNPADGLISYVHVYTRALSAPEVAQIMYCPGSVTGSLEGYWPLTDSTTQYDQSGNANNGTNVGTAASTDGPPVSTNCAGAIQ